MLHVSVVSGSEPMTIGPQQNALGKARRGIFLDRDGVLIHTNVIGGKPYAIAPSDRLEILDGVRESCAALSRAGFLMVMVTNQPDVARGATPRSFVEAVNGLLASELGLADARVCYHDDADGCECRKPKPGLITEAATALAIDLAGSIMIGDRWRDIEAGARAGCRTVLIGDGYRERMLRPPDFRAPSLLRALPWLLSPLASERV
jgi:D-glycero-D-manno-heptose 1,7-bisphosphate phosphatase